MSAEICPYCGCMVKESADRCPLCGKFVNEPLADTDMSVKETFGATEKAKLAMSKKRIAILIGIFIAIAVVVWAIASAIVSDNEIKARVENISSTQETSKLDLRLGYDGGNVAAGGIVCATNSGVYIATGKNVFEYETESKLDLTQGEFAECCSSDVESLVFVNDVLYGISGQETSQVPGSGSSIVADGAVLYEAKGGMTLSCLQATDNAIWFLEHSGTTFNLLRFNPTKNTNISASAGVTVSSAFTCTADNAWLLVDNGVLYLVWTLNNTWYLAECKTADFVYGKALSTNVKLDGEGELEAVCLFDKAFYFALKGKEENLQRLSLEGGYKEYPEIVDVLRIVASADTVCALCSDGSLFTLDRATGLVHDISKLLENVLPNLRPSYTGIGICGDLIAVCDKGKAAVIDTVGQTVRLLEDAAADSEKQREGDSEVGVALEIMSDGTVFVDYRQSKLLDE